MDKLIEKLSKCCNYFSKLSGFPDLSLAKYFRSLLNSPNLIIQQCFAIAMQIFFFFLVLRDGEIIMVKNLESKKKKLALTLFYYVSREICLGNSKKLICINQSGFYILSHSREFKNV